ncbi:hypothetical protein D3C85_1664480 [compost metagenome]
MLEAPRIRLVRGFTPSKERVACKALEPSSFSQISALSVRNVVRIMRACCGFEVTVPKEDRSKELPTAAEIAAMPARSALSWLLAK